MSVLSSFRNAIAATAVAVSLSAVPALAQETVVRFSTPGPATDFLSRSMEVFSNVVRDANVGLRVEIYPGGTLFRQGTTVPAMQRGNLEMASLTTFEIAGQMPRWGFLNRAYLFRDFDHMNAVMSGPVGDQLVDEVARDMGIVVLGRAYLGTRQLNLRRARDISGPDDLRGVKLRMPGSPEWLLLGETLGVEPTPMDMAEVYLSLQTGAIDGQENPLAITVAAGLHEVTDQIALTSHLVQPVFLAIAQDFFGSLSAEQQAALRAAGEAAAEWNNTMRSEDEQTLVNRLRNDLGVRVDEIDTTAFRTRADAIYAASSLAANWDQSLMQEAMR